MIRDKHEKLLVAQLRHETAEVRACFRDFSFKTLAVSTPLLSGVIAGMAAGVEWVALAGAPMIVLSMIVCRIGIFKFSTANRHYGYELHLARIARIQAKFSGKRKLLFDVREITWEEALRAWRVVQAVIFQKIYRCPQTYRRAVYLKDHKIGVINHFLPSLYKLTDCAKVVIDNYRCRIDSSEEANNIRDYPWFCPGILTESKLSDSQDKRESFYWSGSYLTSVMQLLVLMQHMLLLPILAQAVVELVKGNVLGSTMFGIAYAMLLVIVLLRQKRMARRREILEDELLSIHSCAVTWHTVVVAHYLALQEVKVYHKHYTYHLTRIAREVADHVFHIQDWTIEKHKLLSQAAL